MGWTVAQIEAYSMMFLLLPSYRLIFHLKLVHHFISLKKSNENQRLAQILKQELNFWMKNIIPYQYNPIRVRQTVLTCWLAGLLEICLWSHFRKKPAKSGNFLLGIWTNLEENRSPFEGSSKNVMLWASIWATVQAIMIMHLGTKADFAIWGWCPCIRGVGQKVSDSK